MAAIVIIPARYDSTRFPGKPLSLLKGKPLIQHVYENSKGARLAEDVIVATDSETIFEKVLFFGGRAAMTSAVHPSGTDRIAEVAASLGHDIVVNVQGDEPLIRPQMIDDVIELLEDSRASVGTLVKRISKPEEIADPNVVKAVLDKEGFALYFSRSPIPYHRDLFCQKPGIEDALTNVVGGAASGFQDLQTSRLCMFKHIGIYSYRREVLLLLSKMEQTELEKTEKLEQLRVLENGMRIRAKETNFETCGVDTPEDLKRVEQWLSSSL
jgi:3-deoxy-manno-octulosonate cytidylyltransferase (CMP-KDO synthetase)